MDSKPEDTKEALISAAGELFSVGGLEGTSTREIAAKAGVNIGGIHYHFGSKEKLYSAAVLHVISLTINPLDENLTNDKALSKPKGVSNALAALIRSRFSSLYSKEFPRWHGRLIARCMVDSPAAVSEVVEKVTRPDTTALVGLFRRARPGLSKEDGLLWVFTFVSHLIFYSQNREAALTLLNRTEFGDGFFERAAEHTIRVMVRGLGLPAPSRMR